MRHDIATASPRHRYVIATSSPRHRRTRTPPSTSANTPRPHAPPPLPLLLGVVRRAQRLCRRHDEVVVRPYYMCDAINACGDAMRCTMRCDAMQCDALAMQCTCNALAMHLQCDAYAMHLQYICICMCICICNAMQCNAMQCTCNALALAIQCYAYAMQCNAMHMQHLQYNAMHMQCNAWHNALHNALHMHCICIAYALAINVKSCHVACNM